MSPRDLERELDETPDTPTTTWQPHPGDTLVGVLRQQDTVASKFGGDQPRLLIETASGDLVTVYARHAVLRSELARQQPGVGDRIAIRRLQDDPQKDYKRYKVIVDHVTAPPASPEPPDDDIEFAFGPNGGKVPQ